MCGRLKHHESKHDQNAMHFTVRIGTLHFSAKLGKAKSVLPRLGERNPKQSQPANSNPSLMRQRTAIADGPSLLGTPLLIPPHTRATLPSMTHRHPYGQPPLPAMMRHRMSHISSKSTSAGGLRTIRRSQLPKPPVLPATECDKMRQFATHFSEKPPLRRPPAQPQPPLPRPHPCHSANDDAHRGISGSRASHALQMAPLLH